MAGIPTESPLVLRESLGSSHNRLTSAEDYARGFTFGLSARRSFGREGCIPCRTERQSLTLAYPASLIQLTMTFLRAGSRSLALGVSSHAQPREARLLPLLAPGYGPRAWWKRRHLLRFRSRVARRCSVERTTCLDRQRSTPSMQNPPQSQILMPLSDWRTSAAW